MSGSSCVQSRRVYWGLLVAALALPLGSIAYSASVPGNMIAFRVEMMLAGKGSVRALTPASPLAEADLKPLPPQAAALFYTDGKGPRADKVLTLGAAYTKKQPVMASLISAGGVEDAIEGAAEATASIRTPVQAPSLAEVGQASKGNLLNVSTVPLNQPLQDRLTSSLFLSPYSDEGFDLDSAINIRALTATAFAPIKEDTISYKGESEAEFEERERRCLATAIYFEARGEPVRGQLAVAQVIMNRVRSPNFPDTICGVVYQGQFERHCQFSFACDGRSDMPKQNDQWALAQDLAKQVTSGEVWLPEVDYSTYYHADYVRPRWVRNMSRIDSIGSHIFYERRNETPYVVPADSQQQASAELVPPEPATLGPLPDDASPESASADSPEPKSRISVNVSGFARVSATSTSEGGLHFSN